MSSSRSSADISIAIAGAGNSFEATECDDRACDESLFPSALHPLFDKQLPLEVWHQCQWAEGMTAARNKVGFAQIQIK